MPKRNFNFKYVNISIFGLIGVVFLLITLVIAVWATDNPLKRYILQPKACESAQECADAQLRQAERKAAYEGGDEWEVAGGGQCKGAECLLIQLGGGTMPNGKIVISTKQSQYCTNQGTTYNVTTKSCNPINPSPADIATENRAIEKDCQAQGWVYNNGWCYPQVDPTTFYNVATGQATSAEIALVTSYCQATTATQNPDCSQQSIQTLSTNTLITMYNDPDIISKMKQQESDLEQYVNTAKANDALQKFANANGNYTYTPEEAEAIQQLCLQQNGPVEVCQTKNLNQFSLDYLDMVAQAQFDQNVSEYNALNPNTPLTISYKPNLAALGSLENPNILGPKFTAFVPNIPEYAVCQGKDDTNTPTNEQEVCNQNLYAVENTSFLGIGNYIQSFAPGSEITYYYWNRKGYSNKQDCINNDPNPESCAFVSTELYKDRLVVSSITGVQVANIIVGGYYLVNAIPAAISAYNASLAINATLGRALLSGSLSLVSSLGTAANTYFLGQSAAQSIQLCAYGQEGCGLSLAYTALSFANTTFSMYSFGLSTAISNSIINTGQITRDLFISSGRARMMNIPLSFINMSVSGVQTYQYCAQYGVDGRCLFQSSMTALIAAGGVSDYIYLKSLYQSLQPIIQVEGIVDDLDDIALAPSSFDNQNIVEGSTVGSNSSVVPIADDFTIAMGVEPVGIPINTAPNPNLGAVISGTALTMGPDITNGFITNSPSLDIQLSVPVAQIPQTITINIPANQLGIINLDTISSDLGVSIHIYENGTAQLVNINSSPIVIQRDGNLITIQNNTNLETGDIILLPNGKTATFNGSDLDLTLTPINHVEIVDGFETIELAIARLPNNQIVIATQDPSMGGFYVSYDNGNTFEFSNNLINPSEGTQISVNSNGSNPYIVHAENGTIQLVREDTSILIDALGRFVPNTEGLQVLANKLAKIINPMITAIDSGLRAALTASPLSIIPQITKTPLNIPTKLTVQQKANIEMADLMNKYLKSIESPLKVEIKEKPYPFEIQIFENQDPKNPIKTFWAGTTDTGLFESIIPNQIGPISKEKDLLPLIKDINIKNENDVGGINYRGQGYGGSLVKAFESAAAELGLDTVAATNISDENAYNFWINQGYKPPTNWIENSKNPPYVMVKNITPISKTNTLPINTPQSPSPLAIENSLTGISSPAVGGANLGVQTAQALTATGGNISQAIQLMVTNAESQITNLVTKYIVDGRGWLPWLRTTAPTLAITPIQNIIDNSINLNHTISTDEPTQNWVDNLPVPKISGPQIGDIFDTGELLMRYANHWDGLYDSNTLILTLNPKLTPTIFQNNDIFYDINLSTVKDGTIIPLLKNGYKLLRVDDFKHPVVSESEIPSFSGFDKLIFRGINYEGMQTALKNGSLNSGPIMERVGLGKNIYFGHNAERAFGYAAKGEISYIMATFEKPSYVVVIKQPVDPIVDVFGDIIINKPVSINQIVKIYEIRPFAIKPGNIPAVEDIRNFPGVDVQMMEKLGHSPFMNLPDSFTQIENAPKGQFVYREINLEEVKQEFGITPPIDVPPVIENLVVAAVTNPVSGGANLGLSLARKAITLPSPIEIWNGIRNSNFVTTYIKDSRGWLPWLRTTAPTLAITPIQNPQPGTTIWGDPITNNLTPVDKDLAVPNVSELTTDEIVEIISNRVAINSPYTEIGPGGDGTIYDDLLGIVKRKIAKGADPLDAVAATIYEYHPNNKVYTPPEELAYILDDPTALAARITCGEKLDCLELPILEKQLLIDVGVDAKIVISSGGTKGSPEFPYRHGAIRVGNRMLGYYNPYPTDIGRFLRIAERKNWGTFNIQPTTNNVPTTTISNSAVGGANLGASLGARLARSLQITGSLRDSINLWAYSLENQITNLVYFARDILKIPLDMNLGLEVKDWLGTLTWHNPRNGITNLWKNIITNFNKSSLGLNINFLTHPTGMIKINKLYSIELSARISSVEYSYFQLRAGKKLAPIKITVYDGKIFVVDGANRVSAIFLNGSTLVDYQYSPFFALDKINRELVLSTNSGIHPLLKTPIEGAPKKFPIPIEYLPERDLHGTTPPKTMQQDLVRFVKENIQKYIPQNIMANIVIRGVIIGVGVGIVIILLGIAILFVFFLPKDTVDALQLPSPTAIIQTLTPFVTQTPFAPTAILPTQNATQSPFEQWLQNILGFSIFMQRNGGNIFINQFETWITAGCGPATSFNILSLAGFNPNMDTVLSTYQWGKSGFSNYDSVLNSLEHNGYPSNTLEYGIENRMTDTSGLQNYTGLVVYSGIVTSPTGESIMHLSAFDCFEGNCVSIDSYFSDGKPIQCDISSSSTINCGGYNYHLGDTNGIPDALYPVIPPNSLGL